jgi:hypothetical protein
MTWEKFKKKKDRPIETACFQYYTAFQTKNPHLAQTSSTVFP